MRDVIKGTVGLSKYLGVSYYTARRLVEWPGFPVKVISRRVMLIEAGALREWLAKPENKGWR
jgi:hypothetical protein